MEIKTIREDESILRTRSREVDVKKEWSYIKDIILELKTKLRELGDKAIGLSAIQLGYPVRIFVINFNGEIKTFINPLINKYTNAYFSTEQCLSIPDKEYIILRYHEIEFFYQTPLGKHEGGKLRGYGAQVFQHEYDHLDGILISDGGIENTEEIKNLSKEERIEFFKELADAMDLVVKELKDKSIKELEEEKQKVLEDEHTNETIKEETVEVIDSIISNLVTKEGNDE